MASLFDYRKSQKTAEGLISKFGRMREVQLTVMATDRPGFEPGDTTPDQYIVKAVFVPFNKGMPHDESTPSDTLADASTRRVLMSPFFVPVVAGVRQPATDVVVPRKGDTLSIDGERYTLLGNTTLAPSHDITVYHDMSVIRG